MSDEQGQTDGIEAFRGRVRQFFDDDLPGVLDGVVGTVARAKAWRAALYDAGLAGLDYPVSMGGRGLDVAHRRAYAEESRGRIPPEESAFGIGVGMALPTIRDAASAELASRFVAPGLRGDEIWCQLYSEPGAGSDLASLQTKAVLDGDEWVVSGQKVWTSGAQTADLAILLARTDPAAPKHRGVTMLVLPMRQAGVEVRPLVQMTGQAEFNEVFIDEARVPRDWVVGEVNGGWRMAVALLAHERRQTGLSSVGNGSGDKTKTGRSPLPVRQLRELARDQGRSDDPVHRQHLASLHTGEVVTAQMRGRGGSHPSIGKLWRTIQGRAAAQEAFELAFPAGPAWESDDDELDYWQYHVLNCRAMSIGGGTDEMQRNTLGERALGLPREPSSDTEVPFKDLQVNRLRE